MSTDYTVTPDETEVTLGKSGTVSDVTFDVSRSGDTSQAEDIPWAIVGPSGLSPSLFAGTNGSYPSGTVHFAAGASQSTQSITIGVNGGTRGFTFGVELARTDTSQATISDDQSGGYGVTERDYVINAGGGTLTFDYDMYTIPDQADIYVDGVRALSTYQPVSDTGTLTYAGTPAVPLNTGSQVQVIITGKIQGTAWDYNLSYVPGISSVVAGYVDVEAPPPSKLDYAELSADVYEQSPSGTSGYEEVDQQFTPYGGIGADANYPGYQAQAYSNGDGSQIVIAIRGTDLDDGAHTEVKNLVSDVSFATGHATANLTQEVSDAAQFVAAVYKANPNANITLTGHSLGGAVAQLVANAAGLSATTFDAPGAAGFESALTTQLEPVSGLSSGGTLTDYRLYGDQISLAGSQIGSTYTLPSQIPDLPWNFLDNHDKYTMVDRIADLEDGTISASYGVSGSEPNYTAAVLTAVMPITSSLGFSVFQTVVDATTLYAWDPSGGTTFTLTADSNSPRFRAITLPGLPDVSYYTVSEQTASGWSTPTTLSPAANLTFSSPTAAVRFEAFNASGKPIALPDGFSFGLGYATAGTANVTLQARTDTFAFDVSGDGDGDLVWQNLNGQATTWLMNGNTVASVDLTGPANGPTWRVKSVGDLNDDGEADLVWQSTTGQVTAWLMNSHDPYKTALIGGAIGAGWEVKGTADLTGTGRSDIVLENNQGQAVAWFMDGLSLLGAVGVGNANGANWQVRATGDFNGDGKDDILLENSAGQVRIDFMSGGTLLSSVDVGSISPNLGAQWQVKGVGDFNGDGKDDVVWENRQGQADVWLMNGSSVLSSVSIGGPNGSNVQIKEVADLNGDGSPDLVWQDASGQAYGWLMNGTTVSSVKALGGANGSNWSLASDDIAPTRFDTDGDGKADLIWQNDQGQVALWSMNGPSLRSTSLLGGANGSSFSAFSSGDLDGDGRSDIVWQTSNGQVGAWLMGNGTVLSASAIGGANGTGFKVVGLGDLNGDGMSDIVWQTSSGQVGVWLMNGTNIVSAAAVGGPLGGDWQVKGVGDLDGDGRADIVLENSQGQAVSWLMNGTTLTGAYGLGGANGANWNVAGLGDLSGSGKSDVLWQNSSGQAVDWQTNGTTVSHATAIGPANGPGVDIKEITDLNGDGKADLVWQTDHGQAVAWMMSGTTLLSANAVGPANGSNWHMLASA